MKTKFLFLGILLFFAFSCANTEKKDAGTNSVEKSEDVAIKVKNEVVVDDSTLIYKVSLGVLPDLAYKGVGVKAAKVHAGRPGALGGLQDNDIVTKIDNKPVKNLIEYTKMLGKHKAGESVVLTVMRGEKELQLNITFD